MKTNVNFDIALTHIFTRKRQTLVAALGVTIGVGMYIFMNSLMNGFKKYSRDEIFKSNAHIKIFNEDQLSTPILSLEPGDSSQRIIINPNITTLTKALNNPQKIINQIRQETYTTHVAPQVNVDVFYNKGNSQQNGVANGIYVDDADAMFNIRSTMLSGSLEDLKSNHNGIIVGEGIAKKLNLEINDNITISSSKNVLKVFKVVGVFSAGNKAADESKSYINIAAAQQLHKEGISYVTDIYVNTLNPDLAPAFSKELQLLTTYKVEPWQITNEDLLSGEAIRNIMSTAVSFTILLVAAFGIYNILNMTINQKIKDIAILKATGFKGKDIIRIFVLEAIIMGIIGTIVGLFVGVLCINILSKVYIGGTVGNFPIYFNTQVFLYGAFFGILVTTAAGYIPAKQAASVDPVKIFRQ